MLKDIEDYEGYYKVSEDGCVFSVIKQKYVSIGTNKKNGYKSVSLYKKTKRKVLYVHRLVAQAFLEKIDGKDYVDHINGDRGDNRVENLRWCTAKENCNFPLTKERQREAHRGYVPSEHQRKIMREKMSGKNHPFWGKKFSEETKRKIREAVSNPSLETRAKIGECHKRKIKQYTKEGVFIKEWNSAVEAARELGYDTVSLRHARTGVRKTYKGYIWK